MNLVCPDCRSGYPGDAAVWRCHCGSYLDIEFEADFPLAKIKAGKPSMWRYRDAIPIEDDDCIISFDEGFTPLLRIALENRPVFIKQEHLQPTGSFKDRGASVLISRVKELGINNVIEDSSGNAGAAIAAYCAYGGVKCSIYVPENAPPGKLIQIMSYGADLIRIRGNREDVAAAAQERAQDTFYAGHVWNPFFIHGVKTFAYEICEQLGWVPPDVIILPVGNGTLLLGCYIGFKELIKRGIVGKLPRLIGIQAENCSPLYRAFMEKAGNTDIGEAKETIADGIAVAKPIRWKQIIKAVRQSRGDFITVSEDEIKDSLVSIIKRGFYIEPTAAATIAGVKKYILRNKTDELIVSAFTGCGFKASHKISEIIAGIEL